MATIFGYCPATSEAYYYTTADPATLLPAVGFAKTGDVTAHGKEVYSRPPGNKPDANAMGILDRSINRIAPGSVKPGWNDADAAAWSSAHPGVVAFAVFQV